MRKVLASDRPLELVVALPACFSILFLIPGITSALRDHVMDSSIWFEPFQVLTSFLIFFITFYVWYFVRGWLPYLTDLFVLSFVLNFFCPGGSALLFALATFCTIILFLVSPQARRTLRFSFTSDASVHEERQVMLTTSGGTALISLLLVIVGFRSLNTILLTLGSWLLVLAMVWRTPGRLVETEVSGSGSPPIIDNFSSTETEPRKVVDQPEPVMSPERIAE